MAKNNPQWIVVHHSATERDRTTFAAVNEYHRKKWNFRSKLGFYLGYHYFIETDGKITHARDNLERGAHTKTADDMNGKSIGVCLAGNFDLEMPSAEQTAQLAELLFQLSQHYGIPPERVRPHRSFQPKSCYGNNLPGTWAEELLRNRMASAVNEDVNTELRANNENRKRVVTRAAELVHTVEGALKELKELLLDI